MIPATLKTTSHYEGNRYLDGYRHFGPISIDGQQPTEPCLYAEMRFVNKSGTVGFSFKSTNAAGSGKLTIVDAVNYEFSIGAVEQELPLSAGTWSWAFDTHCTVDASDPPFTPWVGSIIIVKKVA